MWIKKDDIEKDGGKEKKNWDEMIEIIENLKEKGIKKIENGGKKWKDEKILDEVVI